METDPPTGSDVEEPFQSSPIPHVSITTITTTTTISQNASLEMQVAPPPPPPPPALAETQEQAASLFHKPEIPSTLTPSSALAGGGGSVFPMHKSASVPFMHPSNVDQYVRVPPLSTQGMPAAGAQRRQHQQLLNIGVTFPLKAVLASAPPATSALNPFPAIDAAHCANEARDKGVDNTLVVAIKDRKVRLSNSASDSLYAVCRRWVRNDIPRKDQHDPWDSVRPLPRPLSSGVAESNEERNIEDAKDNNIEVENFSELEGTMENISEDQLLESHVNRAKKIRVRLRDGRRRRIERFKQRLALLLPLHPSMEQNKSDSAVAT